MRVGECIAMSICALRVNVDAMRIADDTVLLFGLRGLHRQADEEGRAFAHFALH